MTTTLTIAGHPITLDLDESDFIDFSDLEPRSHRSPDRMAFPECGTGGGKGRASASGTTTKSAARTSRTQKTRRSA